MTTTHAHTTTPPLPAASARSLLLTVLGEFVYPDNEPVWTSVLVRALAGLGVEERAARQAIARSAAAGWVDSERRGRAVRWTLADHGRRVIEDGQDRIAQFFDCSKSWDRRWLVLLVTIPQSERTTRKRLYGGLAWLGMGSPTPGVWVSPHVGAVDQLRALVNRFGLTGSAMTFVGSNQDVGLTDQQIVDQSWDLDYLAQRYQLLLEQYGDPQPISGSAVLWRHLELRNLVQRFLRLDPRLPEELLSNWVGHRAAALFRTRNEELLPAARVGWMRLVQDVRPVDSRASGRAEDPTALGS